MGKNNVFSEIYSELLEILQNPVYKVGDEIPSASKLAEQFSVSRPTVHKALKKLQNEGVLESRVGSGTFLLKKPEVDGRIPLFGLIFPLLRMEGFFGNVAQSIAEYSKKFNFNLLFGGQVPQGSIDLYSLGHMTDYYIEQGVDGVFIAPVELADDSRIKNELIFKKLAAANIPVVMIDCTPAVFPANQGCDLVSIDNFRAGYMLADYLLQNGSNRIDFCTMPNIGQAVQLRWKGIQNALIDHGIMPQKEWIHVVTEEERLGTKLKAEGAINVVGSNDYVAARIMRALQRKSYAIPKDFRIAGFDGSKLAEEMYPSITTIVQPCDEIAVLAIQAMFNRIQFPDRPISHVMANFSLRIGGST
jgi:LacI family transcriptional regulator